MPLNWPGAKISSRVWDSAVNAMNKAIVQSSTRLYSFLLKLYPQAFRQAFGEEMAYVFSESLNDACAEKGGRGVMAYWGRTIAVSYTHLTLPTSDLV